MRYKDLCAQMDRAGWLSHTIAACNTNHPGGSGEKHFTFRRLSATRTGQAFLAGHRVPSFDVGTAVLATIRYHDEHGPHADTVSIDAANGLLLRIDPITGRRFVAYLSDIPPDRITYASTRSAFPSPAADSKIPDLEAEEMSAKEGSVSVRQHLCRERDRKIVAAKRQQVLAATGRLACVGCTFDFAGFYGEIGVGFCEVHHLRPLGEADGEIETRLEDLVVVCSNCHRMIHHGRPFLSIDELKSKIRDADALAARRM